MRKSILTEDNKLLIFFDGLLVIYPYNKDKSFGFMGDGLAEDAEDMTQIPSAIKYKGRFFKTKKGTKAFEISDNGNDILIVERFSGIRGYRSDLENLPGIKLLTGRRSNGGGAGIYLAVVDKNWKYQPSVNDF